MSDIQKEYSLLFNTITDAQTELVQLYCKLMSAQQRAEELYISHSDEAIGASDNNTYKVCGI